MGLKRDNLSFFSDDHGLPAVELSVLESRPCIRGRTCDGSREMVLQSFASSGSLNVAVILRLLSQLGELKIRHVISIDTVSLRCFPPSMSIVSVPPSDIDKFMRHASGYFLISNIIEDRVIHDPDTTTSH